VIILCNCRRDIHKKLHFYIQVGDFGTVSRVLYLLLRNKSKRNARKYLLIRYVYVRHVRVRNAILVNSPVKVNTFCSSLFLATQMFVTHWPSSNSQSLSNTHSSPTANIKKNYLFLCFLMNSRILISLFYRYLDC
jgi:hypothetical protein